MLQRVFFFCSYIKETAFSFDSQDCICWQVTEKRAGRQSGTGMAAPECPHYPRFLSLDSGLVNAWISFLLAAHNLQEDCFDPRFKYSFKIGRRKMYKWQRQRDIQDLSLSFFQQENKSFLGSHTEQFSAYISLHEMIKNLFRLKEESWEENSFSWAHATLKTGSVREEGRRILIRHFAVSAMEVNTM